ERLRELAARLAAGGAPSPRVAVCDLATPEGRAACREAADALDEPPDVVVLNAGFGSRGSFAPLEAVREVRRVEVNAVAVGGPARAGSRRLRGASSSADVRGPRPAPWPASPRGPSVSRRGGSWPAPPAPSIACGASRRGPSRAQPQVRPGRRRRAPPPVTSA